VEAYRRYVPVMGREPAPMLADYARLVDAEQVRVAVENAVVLGFIVLVMGADQVLVENVAVLPAAQGRGIGAQLMDLAETEAVRLGLGAVSLYTNEVMVENLALYARRGYLEMHRAEEDGFRRVYLSKRVAGGVAGSSPG
jgi:ribosomal protein S18 acetylase RimI-like enzyme